MEEAAWQVRVSRDERVSDKTGNRVPLDSNVSIRKVAVVRSLSVISTRQIHCLYLILTLVGLVAERARAAKKVQPNIVIILADDLGWGDPRCYQADGKIPTPHMDRLAKEGLRFTDAHTPSSVCTPTRYTLLTGRYAWRTRLKSGVLDGFDPPLIRKGEDTIGSLLKRAGYTTHAVGKWHLGMEWKRKDGSVVEDRGAKGTFRQGLDVDFTKPTQGGPLDVGFDSFVGISASLDMSPYCWIKGRGVEAIPSEITEENKDGMFMNQVAGVTTPSFKLEEVLPRIGTEAAAVIRRSKATPFFLYVPLTSPHLPVVPNESSRGRSAAGAYGDFVWETDQALGEILKALDETGQADNTLVLFTSDNGGLFHYWDFRAADDGGRAPKTKRGESNRAFGHQSNADWRGTKADIFEGGHRVPFLIRWPGVAKAGRVVDATVELTDVFATVAEITGQSLKKTSGMDSFSLLPLIKGGKSGRPFSVHHSLNGTFALRKGDLKLVAGRGSGGFTRPRTLQTTNPAGQLYDLAKDAQEITNLYDREPKAVSRLSNILAQVKESGAVATAKELRLTAEETAETAIIPEGFTVDVIAKEPDVIQPIALNWDHRGRLWVAECHTYADRSENYDLTQSDRIVVFEDRDADGTFETRTVFAEGFKRLTGVAVGLGGVWALASPALQFIPDADEDLKPDGPPVPRLDGFDLKYTRHTIANGLKWGPDGWLYGRQGIVATSYLGPLGTPQSQRLAIDTGIWRFDPATGRTEAWTRGGTNPWGHDWAADGELFYINTVIGHFWHGIPGAYTKRMFGQFDGRDYLYRLIDMHADHWHFDIDGSWTNTREDVDAEDAFGGGHAHSGMMIYQANKWPSEYRNDVFTLNFHGRRINREHLVSEGSGFVAKHRPDFVKFTDRWFRGIDLAQGPDGAAYVLDWSDTGECHDHDGIHRASGRIYRVRYGKPASGPVAPPADAKDFLKWLRHPNVWYARKARLLIQQKASKNSLPPNLARSLRDALAQEKDDIIALRLFQALYAMKQVDFAKALADSREIVRAQAIRWLRDATPSEQGKVSQQLRRMARNDTARIRLNLASLLPKLGSHRSLQIDLAQRLLAHTEDADDHNQPLLLWHGLEPLIAQASETELQSLLRACRIPELRKFILRRLAEDYDTKAATISELILRHPKHVLPHLQGLAEALEGLPKAKPLPNWKRIADLAGNHPLVDQLGALFGEGRSLENLFAIANNEDAQPTARRQAVIHLGRSDYPGIKQHLLRWLDDDQLSGVCASALGRFADEDIGKKMVQRFAFMKPEERTSTIDVLVSRSQWCRFLLERIAQKRLAPETLSPVHARQIAAHGDPGITRLLERVWGKVNAQGDDAAAREMESRLRALITEGSLKQADLSAGRAHYQLRCANCHQLYGAGMNIGPDLTGSGRHQLDYLIENVLYPNAVVPVGFQLTNVKLKDGRVLAGVITAQNKTRLTLRTVGVADATLIDRSEVTSIETSPTSLMPAGLLAGMTDQNLIGLFAYLMGDQQVPLKQAQ